MTRYLLDTNFLVDFSKQFAPTRARLLATIANRDALAVCDIVIAEFFSGIEPASHRVWTAFFEECEMLSASREAAARSGIYRYEFARRGITLSLPDSLIAAIAHERRDRV